MYNDEYCWTLSDIDHEGAEYGKQQTSMGHIERMGKDTGQQCYPLEAPETGVGVYWRLPSPTIDFR